MRGVLDEAFCLVDYRNLRVDHNLLEEPGVLRRRVIVGAIDERQPKEGAEPAEDAVQYAGSAHVAAVTRTANGSC